MAAEAINYSGNELTDVTEEFEKLCFSGDLNDTDRRILKYIFANPDATHDDIAEEVGYSRSGVTRRMNRMPFIKARMLFEGTVSEIMQRTVWKFTKRCERIVEFHFDDDTAIQAGKVAIAWLAKQAELDVISQKKNAKPEDLPTLEEARRILSEDPANSDAIEVEIEDL